MVYVLKVYLEDMGRYTTNCHGWEDGLWTVNNAREHDGLRPISLAELMRNAKIKAKY